MELETKPAFAYWPQMIVVIILLVAVGGYHYFAYYNTWSNDAYVSANVINITSLVSGPISHIYVSDNQAVIKGQKLLEIDSRFYQDKMLQAYANYQKIKLAFQTQKLDANELLAAKAHWSETQCAYQHTIITAPTAGYITNFQLSKGQYLQKNQELFALIDTSYWWITTRYRETVLRLIKPGDKARIKIDMYPGKTFHGHVIGIGWGINRLSSGQVVPSTLTYLEATEDWIKISQRFPVQIQIDEVSLSYPLRVGASASTSTYR